VLLAVSLMLAAAATPRFDHDHAAWTALLERYVHDGEVDYGSWKRDGAVPLVTYLAALGAVRPAEYAAWSGPERLAYWINAYNAFTIQLILDHYPLRSIRAIGVLPGAVFRTSFIALPGLRKDKLSLNDLEHEILRKQFGEPRIHFAIVCASRGCPKLRARAYRAADLDRSLDEAARAFIRDGARNRYDAAARTLHLSSIFKWFRGDFERAAGSLVAFVARYAEPTVAAALAATPPPRVEFLDYDWSLNGR
jgi:hypothetical protein